MKCEKFYISLEEGQVLQDNMHTMRFIRRYDVMQPYVSQNHKVFKDYILSSEAYTLPSSFESAS